MYICRLEGGDTGGGGHWRGGHWRGDTHMEMLSDLLNLPRKMLHLFNVYVIFVYIVTRKYIYFCTI